MRLKDTPPAADNPISSLCTRFEVLLRRLPFLLIVLVATLSSLPTAAEAQIYSWREADGSRMYSGEPPRGDVTGFRVIGTPFRSTRSADSRFASSYDAIIEKHADTYQVSPQLVRAVIQVESGFNPRAVSAKGAMGLMQLMPATAIEMGVRNPFDPDQNIRGGAAYLRVLLNRYAGDEEKALAAYNAGPEAVARYGDQVPPYRETRKYVAQVGNRAGLNPAVSSGVRPKPAASSPSKPAAATARVYKFWEKTEDGRLILKFSDTKPASGPYEIVR
jgi:soluble lytic murein transglycosylase-like protein